MALCFLIAGSISIAELPQEVGGLYVMCEYLMDKTLAFGRGTAYDLYTQAIVTTNLQTDEKQCWLTMDKAGSVTKIGMEEIEELLVMLPVLKEKVQSDIRGKTEYLYQTKSGVQIAVVMDSGKALFLFKLTPSDNTSRCTFELSAIDQVIEYLNEYAIFFREECK